MGVAIYDEKAPVNGHVQLTAASGTALSEILSVSSPANRCDSILVVNNSASDHVVIVTQAYGGVDRELIRVTVPANAGMGDVASVDLLASLPATVQGIICAGYQVLKVGLTAALTGGDTMDLTAFGGYL